MCDMKMGLEGGTAANNAAPPMIPSILSFVMDRVSMIYAALDLFRHPQRADVHTARSDAGLISSVPIRTLEMINREEPLAGLAGS